MTGSFGEPHLHFETLDSTNRLAKEQADAGAMSGTTITAAAQTAGRGRQGRAWIAPPGGALLMSVIVRPLEARHRVASLAAAVAVAETCEALAGVTATIKWPNDIWIDARKVAGILIEARPERDPERSWMVVGVGLNTSLDVDELPDEFRARSASLGLDPETDALTPLLTRLHANLLAEPQATIEAWRARDALAGRRIAWDKGEGVAGGIDDDGNLIARLGDGSSVTLRAGEVHLSLSHPA
jgi:BirA family biotin operon repressor/biotin-[acetyl-CoA-carboxylase] ligase